MSRHSNRSYLLSKVPRYHLVGQKWLARSCIHVFIDIDKYSVLFNVKILTLNGRLRGLDGIGSPARCRATRCGFRACRFMSN